MKRYVIFAVIGPFIGGFWLLMTSTMMSGYLQGASLAEAYRKAQEVKGEGDAKAAAIYAQAFGQDRDFYRFYRSLEAYRSSFRSKNDVMVVDPSSEFFNFMRSSVGTPPTR